jgi:hypothetical protein
MLLTWALTAFTQARACPFRPDCPGGIAAQTMIMWIPQPICCGIHMIKEISIDPMGRTAPTPGETGS